MANSAQSSSKSPCLFSEEKEIDRISDLPNAVLCHILSFLPTVDSVSTTILSKRWEALWTQVPALNFYYNYPIKKASWFLNLVNNVLCMSKAGSIRKFTLHTTCPREIDEQVIREWIDSAVRRNVQELFLDFDWFSEPRAKLPGCLFDCKALVSLELKDGIFLDVPATVHLPCLRILQLMGVRYANDDSLRRLFSGCPVLEDLTIVIKRYDDNITDLDINVPSLKMITVKYYDYLGQPDSKLLITTPMLERIDLKGRIYLDFPTEDAPNLAEAIIEVSRRNQWFNLLKTMASVRFLSLLTSWHIVEFPVFQNLVRLNVECSCQYWLALLALLECSDHLKILKYRNLPFHRQFGCCLPSLQKSHVPKCVSMSLKTIIFRDFCNHKCELRFLRYIVRNAKFLEQVKIFMFSGTCLKEEDRCFVREKLLKYTEALDISFYI